MLIEGGIFIAPENTLASATLAWELGADAVEIDVHLSADNRVMVIHDDNTKRVTQGKSNLKISETPSDLLRSVDDPKVVERLNDLGVTTVTTNRPGWLKVQVENIN